MNKQIKHLAALAALSLLGATSGQASILGGDAAGGSEVILTLANSVGDSISQDLGTQAAGLAGNFALSAPVLNFINTAGASNVTFSIIAGSTTTRTYLTSSASATFAADSVVANGAKSLWASTINGLVGDLNFGDATPPATNLTYGPFAAGSGSPNFQDGVYDSWQSGDFQFSSLGSALDPLYLYTTTFLTSNTGTVPFLPSSRTACLRS